MRDDRELTYLCLDCGGVVASVADHYRLTGHRRHRPVYVTRDGTGAATIDPTRVPLFWTGDNTHLPED